MGRLATLWEREVLSRVLDRGMRDVAPVRSALLAQARGRVVELGFGTGANLPHFGAGITELVAVEPAEGLAAVARPRLERWGAERGARVSIVEASASRPLPLDAGSFDTAVITFVLCSVKHPRAMLDEVRRLLAPGGRLLIAEHVLARSGATRATQLAIRPAWKALVGGCDPARDTRALLEESGWDTRELRDERLALPFPVHPGLIGSTRSG